MFSQKNYQENSLLYTYWLAALIFLTFCIIILGSFTRLSGSGLSMVDWQPIMGIFPPIFQEGWEDAFKLYQQFPEYQLVKNKMTLEEYKFIYLVEYSHRMLGRLIGLVTILPFAYMWVMDKIGFRDKMHGIILSFLIVLQGIVGWYMVQSGLVDQPSISHFRLALHLSLATIFVTYAILLLASHEGKRRKQRYTTISGAKINEKNSLFLPIFWTIGFFLLICQFLLGAFVAGLDAGLVSSNYPKMFGQWIPSEQLNHLQSFFSFDWLYHAVSIHFLHRHLGIIVGLLLATLAVNDLRKKHFPSSHRKVAMIMLLLCLLQPILGIMVVAMRVPTFLAISHQVSAVLLFNCTTFLWIKHIKSLKKLSA